ncbi:UDP-Glycosyltransferase/glycogen phosphorylase [Aspergillus sclerotioniger CBS 115572]|uniref:UDP-Glycosyltransferase/glycogen phosphorylase n=1 Tax=Aspergillus sclerotioniger CBS 115572 TaxID=1450535 RepID=A0A317UWI2_9EURO|nr:UDP-Glycosyltransferase/glycogen phosphorylase [Aspergillus sclerotioniger CBS 115572]PWY66035.1 UDP-Glycosyltransferase/glycogen phosphorylase [Aspergillus sclerotioniger CBS 115572]
MSSRRASLTRTSLHKRRCVLFLTNSERGKASVLLAVAYEFLLNSSYEIHVGSFRSLKKQIAELNYHVATHDSVRNAAVLEEIPGPSMKQARFRDGQLEEGWDVRKVGLCTALETYRNVLAPALLPWTGVEYVSIYDAIVGVIQALIPRLIIVDPSFVPAVDVCRNLHWRHVLLGPNPAKEQVIQLGSGFTYPLKCWAKLRNAYLGIHLESAIKDSENFKDVEEARHSRGIEGSIPIPYVHPEIAVNNTIISPARLETDFPLTLPDNVVLCGPIVRPYRLIEMEDPEIAHWLSQRPTVLINMGTRFYYDDKKQAEFGKAVCKLLDAKPDMQVLWKLQRDEGVTVSQGLIEMLQVHLDEQRVRVESWFAFEPMSLLMSGHITCVVHHGGANAYHEAVRAAIPQVVLPVWFETYNFAARVEYLGIGVWGSRKTAPVVSGEELGEALLRVVASDEPKGMRERAMYVSAQLPLKHGRAIAYDKILEAMARNIAEKGPQTKPITLYNRTASKATTFASSLPANKATFSTSLSDAISNATIIFICVGDDAALEAVISGLPTTSLSSKIIVDCSTVHPDTSRKAQSTLASHGASFIACPVFGAPAAATAGQLIVVPAGDASSIDRIKPFLDGVTSKATISMAGEDVGRATTLKILGNTFILNTVETVAEGLVTAEKCGLGTDVYRQFMQTFFPGPFALYADRMITGDYYKREEPLFGVDLARKDLRHAASLAGEAGVRLRSVEVTDQYLQKVKEEMGVKGDIAGVYGAVRRESGLEFEN